MTERDASAGEHEPGAEVVAGEGADASFEFSTEAEPHTGSSDAGAGDSAPPQDPFAAVRDAPLDDLAIELDPTDPGFTTEDLEAMPPGDVAAEWPPPPGLDRRRAAEDAGPEGSAAVADPGPGDGDGGNRLTDDGYLSSSTTEYRGLAEELSRARYEETEQIAVAANMPGVEAGVVGLEDVTGEPAVIIPEAPSARLADLTLRIATGVGLLGLFFLSLQWQPGLGLLAVALFGIAAGEYYAVLVRTGHHPVSAFGLLGVAGCLVGAWVWGVTAIPVAVAATFIAVPLYYGTTAPRPDTLRDASLTVLGAVWIGALGSFAMPIIKADGYRWLISGVVLIVAALDVGQYFFGRWFGRRPLAPVVSPKKTVEGLVGGAVAALLMGFGLSFFEPFDLMSTLVLAGAAIVLGPLGDLAVSAMKRRIGVKDMGTVLPGHGGILDRIDALLFVIPAAWVVFRATGLI